MSLFIKESGLFRIAMRDRIQKIAQEANIEVILPKTHLVAYANATNVKDPTKKYCIISEKLNTLSVTETVDAIKKMTADKQKELARTIAALVKKAGIVDARFHNIRLTKENKLAIIATEPTDLMVKKPTSLFNKVFGSKSASVEKCARIGLYRLQGQATKGAIGSLQEQAQMTQAQARETEPGLEVFRKEIQLAYTEVATPQLNKRKIILSIAIPIIPVVYAIVSIAKNIMAAYYIDQIISTAKSFQFSVFKELGEASKELLTKKQAPFIRKLIENKEGVPHKTPLSRYVRGVRLQMMKGRVMGWVS